MAEVELIPGQVAPLDIEGAKAGRGESVGQGLYNLWVGLNNEIRDRRHAIAASINSAQILHDIHTNRPAAGGLSGGTMFYETDRGVTYVNIGGVWRWVWGEMVAAFGGEPTDLGADDVGFLLFVSDYAHHVRWTGSAWGFVDDGNAFFQLFSTAPGVGWALCDGGATDRLVIGATLTVSGFTTPNLTGSPAYLKSGASYTGLNAAGGTVATESSHTHGPGSYQTGNPTGTEEVQAGTGAFVASETHFHRDADDPWAGLSDPSSHAHGPGTLELSRLIALPYWRR